MSNNDFFYRKCLIINNASRELMILKESVDYFINRFHDNLNIS